MTTLHQLVVALSVQGVEVWTGWANAGLSMVTIFVCICRARQMTRHVLIRIKLSYLGLIMGSFTNAVSPGLGEMPGWCSVAFAFSVLAMLVADSFQWRRGLPESATDRAPLGLF